MRYSGRTVRHPIPNAEIESNIAFRLSTALGTSLLPFRAPRATRPPVRSTLEANFARGKPRSTVDTATSILSSRKSGSSFRYRQGFHSALGYAGGGRGKTEGGVVHLQWLGRPTRTGRSYRFCVQLHRIVHGYDSGAR